MKVTVTDAKANLADLIQRAEAGEEVVLTENGKSVVKSVAISKRLTEDDDHQMIEEIRANATQRLPHGLDAARSQDFLYDELGLPK